MFPSFNEDRLEKSLIIFVLSFRLNLSWDSWIVEGRTCFFENCFRFQILKKNWPQMLTSAVVMIISWWVWLLDSYQHPVSSVMRPNVHFSAQPEATTVSCQGPLEQVCTHMWTARTWKRVCDVRRSPIFYFFFFNHLFVLQSLPQTHTQIRTLTVHSITALDRARNPSVAKQTFYSCPCSHSLADDGQ